jgi:D-serine deaminase-like pyridoxal phosphate-dependent protein
MENSNWYSFDNVDAVDSPALLLYKDRILQNIDRIIKMVDDVNQLRPHVKTNKSVDVSRLMIEKGISKFKCATIAEAEMLGMAKTQDVLLAYQPTETKLMRLLAILAAYPETSYSLLIDNADTAKMVSAKAMKANIMLSVYIDVNAGMGRTGILPKKALLLYQLINELPNIEFAGLHAYDGHINDVDIADREKECAKAFAPVEELRQQILSLSGQLPMLIAGGSPTFLIHAKRENTECSPGTFIFWDKNYHDHIPEQNFDFAALVLTRVISLPNDTQICVDLGYKAISCEHNLQSRVYFLNAPDLKPYSHSEEHLVLDAGPGHGYQIGDVLYGLPLHICPTVAMYNNAYVIEQGRYHKRWTITARGRELSF